MGMRKARGEEKGSGHALSRSYPTWQEVAIVHQDVEMVGAQEEDVTLQIWPSKGAIQFEEGTLNEQQVYRQEANISMLVLLACRLHLAVSEVAYKRSHIGGGRVGRKRYNTITK